MAKKKIPYTYLLRHTPTGKVYYGVRFGRGANPDELLVSYFTSSKTVKKLIDTFGVDSFEAEIRKTFSDGKAAMMWESRVLKRINAAGHPMFLNKTNNNSFINTAGERNWAYGLPSHLTPMYGKTHTAEARKRISEAHKGKPKSEEARAKMSEAKQNMSAETKQKMSRAHKNRSATHQAKLNESVRGRLWIKCEDVCKLIKPEELQYWIDAGWERGRIIIKVEHTQRSI